ncbi:MAG TPA: phosphate ABC transporter permease subunit PstC [Tepidisphaeraceae bacterium]|nr:phosphate ABC transporter permease subunit PstC [Tepidisphaeraceae bacterium]
MSQSSSDALGAAVAIPAVLGYKSPQSRPQRRFAFRVNSDTLLQGAALMGALCILLMLASLLAVLFYAALPAIRNFGFGFLVSTEWRPNELEQPKRGPDGKILIQDGETVMETMPPAFGALPVIYGTAVSSALSLLFAVPLSLGAALFLIRAAPRFMKGPVSFLIEFLAAIPSIAYGIWGLFVLAPFLQQYVEPKLKTMLDPVPGMHWMFQSEVMVGAHAIMRPLSLTGRDMFGGSLVLAIMIIPIITAISRDVLNQVPRAQIEGSVALGATWWQSSKEMLKFSRSGLFGAVMLGLARAAGETMAVTMVIGNNNQIVPSPFAPAQTMSSLLANEFAEASTTLHRAALCEVALILLLMSLIFNVVARWLVVGKNSRAGATH